MGALAGSVHQFHPPRKVFNHTSIFMLASEKLLHVQYNVRGENGKRRYNKNAKKKKTQSQVEARFQG